MLFVEIYTKTPCKWCVLAKALLKEKLGHTSAIIKEIPIASATDEALVDLKQRNPLARSLPQIFINNTIVGGHDELVIWFQKNPPADPQVSEQL